VPADPTGDASSERDTVRAQEVRTKRREEWKSELRDMAREVLICAVVALPWWLLICWFFQLPLSGTRYLAVFYGALYLRMWRRIEDERDERTALERFNRWYEFRRERM
jgi:hypothetical protein